jgi:hypothetical protein
VLTSLNSQQVTCSPSGKEQTFYTGAADQAANEVTVQWLETFVVVEAGAGFVLAGMNCRRLVGYTRAARSAARRTGASALALVSAAFALEALTFLASPAIEASPDLRDVSVIALRSAMLAASGAISVLLLRSGHSRA